MGKWTAVSFGWLVLAGLPVLAQDTPWDLRSEVNIYVNQGSRIRLLFQDSLRESQEKPHINGSFGCFIDIALRPVFRRELRHAEDVFRRHYLTIRGGYQHSTGLASETSSSENRSILELNARYPLPAGFVVLNRNRGEFRFIQGSGFSTRYRNRLWLEHDIQIKALVATPYVYGEAYFDSRYDAWTQDRLAMGVQFPAGPHFVIEPYALRQRKTRSTPTLSQALGLKFNFYF